MLKGGPLLTLGASRFVAGFLAVQAQEKVVITADRDTDEEALAAVFDAVTRTGARPCVVMIPTVPYQGSLADPYLPEALSAAVCVADVWIDMAFPYLAGSHPHEVALKGGKLRYALTGDVGAGGIVRLFGSCNLDTYFDAHVYMDDMFAEADGKPARITCPNGSDVRFVIAKAPYRKPRVANRPGSYTLPGSCALFPVLESVQGTLAFTAIFHENYSIVAPVLTVKVDGKIRSVDGPTEHRVVLDRALRRAGAGEYGNVIHFTHGLSPTARTTGRSFIEDSRVLGANAVGMGLPWWVPGGGENHPDGVISGQSLWVDEVQIVKDGVVVAPPPLLDRASKLVPEVINY
jgi:2,5-dihydroxypyridine 5,6-dioxygenase